MNILFVLILCIILYSIFDLIKKNKKFSKNDPPGFKVSLPIMGDLLQIGDRPHRTFKELEEKFNKGIFKLWMGDIYTVVVTDVDMINEVLVKKGNIFVNRPSVNSFNQWSYNGRGLVMANDNEWRRIRNLVAGAFSKTKVSRISGLIEDQTRHLINSLNEHNEKNIPFYPKALLSKFTLNVIGRLFFSKDVCTDEDIAAVENQTKRLIVPILKVFKTLGIGHLDDFISIIYPFLFLKRKNLQVSIDEIYDFMKEIYFDHLKNIDYENPKDLMDILIIDTDGKDEKLVVHTAMDFLLGGSHTSESTMQYFLLKIVEQPHIQKKVYEEMISVAGEDCKFITLDHCKKLTYLNACIKEVLRMMPITPLSVPRVNNEDTEIGGYFVPKGTQIIPNLYGLSNLAKYVENPEKYIPERWLEPNNNNNTNISPSTDKYFNNLMKVSVPFSAGIRGCPAYFLAIDEIMSSCSNMVLNYTFESFDGKTIDQTEVFGLTVYPKPYHLKINKRN
ncbi:hypothetical protein DICPUDRAFT_54851 [Dictyostelium purpureum]|uniref:Cytochrome P450 family protein n=1 Tax=Dictyostelium purpureum TaxID=5786 RepID=F0ZJ76_DICPU|nr:uncharacterized protein DICPUDRAFT_54851 [Dictyostelium purpureum]EGC36032.1 hypothetical protein DICPUDRAFT_54851 [Dictyostelium purpureum]|eukprot:XP_003287470.1 hypothetical protein DICPUDRAFT_54851 [Dictyostelium purpureum]